MKPYRTMIFVPGNKPSWADKAVAAGADAIILDLEDSVPQAEKGRARQAVRETILRLHETHSRADVWVRPNDRLSELFAHDVEAVLVPGLAGFVIPKVFMARDVVQIDAVIGHVEERDGLETGAVGLIPTFETARSIANCEEIAASSRRISSLFAATGPDADGARELGFEFTPEGQETLFLRSRLVVACRANDLHHPLVGVWQDIPDVEGLRRFAEDNRRLGYRGIILIHPSHIEPANQVFTPNPEAIDRARRLISAFESAEEVGRAAIDFEGQLVDIAHVRTARATIDLAESLGHPD